MILGVGVACSLHFRLTAFWINWHLKELRRSTPPGFFLCEAVAVKFTMSGDRLVTVARARWIMPKLLIPARLSDRTWRVHWRWCQRRASGTGINGCLCRSHCWVPFIPCLHVNYGRRSFPFRTAS